MQRVGDVIFVGVSAAWILLVLAFLTSVRGGLAQTVPPVDLSTISPSQFSDDELDLPYYLAHFHTLANSVVISGANPGFIDLPVWRPQNQQMPYNARVMENVLSLAYFYATDRSWNPYFGHPAVRERLEAAIRFWVDMQSDEGFFSETAVHKWAISPTGFATKYMGETLRLLSEGPAIDPDLLDDLAQADRRAIEAFLTSEDFFEHGKNYSNHYTTIYGGALAYLDLYPDEDLAELLGQRLEEGLAAFQSPAGYFYERRGPDWVYEVEIHHTNHLMAWHYLLGTEMEDEYASAIEDWYDWLSFNAALEPDTAGFVLNHAIETRRTLRFYQENRETSFGRTCFPPAERVTMARAFCESEEERKQRLSRQRAELERTWPNIPPLRVGEFYGYSPVVFLHRNHVRWHPSAEQKAAARDRLPYIRSEEFIHERMDERTKFRATYIRQPDYYATFNTGEPTDQEQQFGLGFVWTPQEGAMLQSQKVADAAWGTADFGSDDVYESDVLDARYELDGRSVSLRSGVRNVGGGRLRISYDLGTQGRKIVDFRQDDIVVTVRHDGRFTETIPILLEADESAELGAGFLRTNAGFAISFDESASATFSAGNLRVGRKRVHLLDIQAQDGLSYRFQF